jgi:hypothetical protein
MVFGIPTTWLLIGGVGFAVGLVFLPLFSIVIGPSLPLGVRTVLGKIWAKMTLITFGSSVVMETDGGHFEWLPIEYDADVEAWKVKYGGNIHHFDDDSALGTLMKEKFGVAHQGISSVLRPAVASVADAHKDEVAADGGQVPGRWTYNDNGERVAVNEYLQVDDGVELVNMRSVLELLRHSGSPQLAKRAEERAKISQNKYSTSDQVLIAGSMLVAFLAGGGLTWFVMGGGSAVPVPTPGMVSVAVGVLTA